MRRAVGADSNSMAVSDIAAGAAGSAFWSALCRQEALDAPAVSRSTLANSTIRFLLIRPTFTITQPSRAPLPALPRSRFLRFGGKVLDHFAEPFDASRIVHFLPEDHGARVHPDHFAVQNFLADLHQIAFVVGTVDHGHEPLLARLHDP